MLNHAGQMIGNMNKNSTFVTGKKAFYFLNHIL